MKALLQKDYIDVKIDTDRMTNGKELALRLRPSGKGGIPWIVILDPEGEELITSDGPNGNIGCPVKPEERSHFVSMIEKTAKEMSEQDLSAFKSLLDKFGEGILAKRKG
ncbi:MAG: hypothetical protein O7H41_11795 [Planctomycetota bacterium]|nr:hypothetical protein [Planctomycetota bacterium]